MVGDFKEAKRRGLHTINDLVISPTPKKASKVLARPGAAAYQLIS
jgi:hypothetical protein